MGNVYEWFCISCMQKKELGKLRIYDFVEDIEEIAKPFFDLHKEHELMLKDDNGVHCYLKGSY